MLMEFESDEKPVFSCKLMPGHRDCAKANINTRLKRSSSAGRHCPSKEAVCLSKYAKSRSGRPDVAVAFMADSDAATRYLEKRREEREKKTPR